MSYIGKNIKKIRAVKKMSQQDFAQLFKLARPSVGAYEEGRAVPKIETVIQVAQYFELSIDTLLTKELTINELVKFDIFKDEFKEDDHLNVHHNKDDIKEQTPLITINMSLEYIVKHKNRDFINNLPVIQFPYTETKKSRAFQIQGSEMENGNCGIHHKDILLCKPVDLDNEELEEDQLYIIVTNDAIRARRFKSLDNGYVFRADNKVYEDTVLDKKGILEIWKAAAIFSNNLKSPSLLEERVSKLESQINKLLK